MREAVGTHAAEDAQVVDAPGQVRIKIGNLDAGLAVLAKLAQRAEQRAGIAHLEQRIAVEIGERLAVCRFSSGLGSKVSTWLTPPYMNRQMTALAVAG